MVKKFVQQAIGYSANMGRGPQHSSLDRSQAYLGTIKASITHACLTMLPLNLLTTIAMLHLQHTACTV